MNCTAWNSVDANAERNSPSDIPSRALATASATTIQTGPATSSPSKPMPTADATPACTIAIVAKAMP